MQLSDFLDFDAIKPAMPGGSKRSLLQQLSNLAGQRLGVPPPAILASLAEREKLGSTGFGQGVAIPHGKMSGLKQIVGVFARLAEPVDFDAADGEPVDIVFLLLAPEGAGAVMPLSGTLMSMSWKMAPGTKPSRV